MDKHIATILSDRLRRLKANPFPSDSKFIARDELGKIFRYRLGAYRALYVVKEVEKLVLVTKIDKRPRVYNR